MSTHQSKKTLNQHKRVIIRDFIILGRKSPSGFASLSMLPPPLIPNYTFTNNDNSSSICTTPKIQKVKNYRKKKMIRLKNVSLYQNLKDVIQFKVKFASKWQKRENMFFQMKIKKQKKNSKSYEKTLIN